MTVKAHPSDARLLAYLDGELGPGERTLTEPHLGTCDTCVRELEELRSASRRLSVALASLDQAPPWEGRGLPPRLRKAQREGRGADIVPLPIDRHASFGRRGSASSPAQSPGRNDPSRRRSLVAAAIFLLLAGGAAAAAIPGSPVRALVERSVEAVSTFLGSEAVEPAALERAPAAEPLSGVAVEPHEGRVDVAILRPAPGVSVQVRVVDSSQVAVSAAGARFRTAPGRIEVLEPVAGELVLELPQDAGVVRVEVDGRLVLEKQGPDLHFLTPAADTSGSEIRFEVTGEDQP